MPSSQEVAIVGYAARLPGAGSASAFWSLLKANASSIGWIGPDRFPTQPYFHPSPDQPGRSYTFAAGLIDDVWGFDATAFGMSPREAEQVDPQQRHLLEVTHDALTHAGIPAGSLAGSGVGVYVGASSVDYGARFFADPAAADVHMMTGNTLSVIANRLSYHFDLHGPSFTVDTACSSSLVALSLACDAIRAGTIDTAIVGGVNLLLSPFSFVGFSRASMLSPTGLCRPFDAAADGYVRAEGAIVLVLRSPEAARRNRNRVHATLVGWGVGQDGRTTGLSLPSADSQRQLLDKVYGEFGLDPAALAFVEAHGTGTPVGDPVEADALGQALGQVRAQPLPIGSVKSNIGHLEPASGLAGVLKTVLSLQHGIVPATLHQQAPNPEIPFDALNLRVVDHNRPLPARRASPLAGVNSFGFGGTNAHVVLRGEDRTVSLVHVAADRPPPPLLLSAHGAERLPEMARRHLDAWPSDPRLVATFAAAAAHQRDALPHRALIRGATPESLQLAVERFAAGEAGAAALTAESLGNDLPVTFLFSGNGAQWAGMGRTAWQASPVFRDSLREIDELFRRRHATSPVEAMLADDLAPRLRRATVAQPLLLALQMATVRSLEAQGLAAQAVLGHSVGEIAAAWCAGVLATDQAIDIVVARSQHQEITRGSGAMAALMLGEREAGVLLAEAGVTDVDLAAINSWRSVTVSGTIEGVDRVLTLAGTRRIGARRLDLDYPFHSRLVEAVREPLLRDLGDLQPRTARRRFVSSVSGQVEDGHALDASWWWRNVREPVRFDAALRSLIEAGHRLFVEIGPRPILASYVRDALREADARGQSIETLDETGAEPGHDPLERTVGRVALAGGRVDRERLFGPPPVQTQPLPAYPWRHVSYRVAPTGEASGIFEAKGHPLLGTRPRRDAWTWFATMDPAVQPWLSDHAVGGLVVFPAAGFVEVLLAAAREIHGDGVLELRDLDILRPLAFDGATSFETQVRVAAETGIAEFLSRARGAGPDWSLNARGIIGRAPHAEAGTIDPTNTGRIVIPRTRVYDVARGLGFDYGATFRRLRHVTFPHPKEALGLLDRDPGVALDGQVIDLTGIDSAFHALFASEEAGVADRPMARMLPVRFTCVRSYAPGIMARHVVARTRRQTAGSMVIDITLADDDGRALLTVDGARLIEVPAVAPADPRALVYRLRRRRLDRPGVPSALVAPNAPVFPVDGAELEEALLLIEAGCLRAGWDAFGDAARLAPGQAIERASSLAGEAGAWPDFLRTALLWHLEARGFVQPTTGSAAGFFLSEDCGLPAVGSVIRTLIDRHPTMALEAAALAQLEKGLPRLLAGETTVDEAIGAGAWHSLEAASRHVAALRDSALEALRTMLMAVPADRHTRLLAVGAAHASALRDLLEEFPQVEAVLTDLEDDRLDQAQATLGNDAGVLRTIPWQALSAPAGPVFDAAIAIDALSILAATGDGLARLHGLLRPRAPLIAAEPAPAIFWDIVRAARPGWWARSAHAEFPVGPLLGAAEWRDELVAAGFTGLEAQPLANDPALGVRLVARRADAAVAPRPPGPALSWDGATTALADALRDCLAAGAPPDHEAAHAAIAFVVDAHAPSTSLADTLARLARTCSALASQEAESARSVHVVVTGALPGTPDLDSQPAWTAIAAALRVAQNEYPALEIRCLGVADGRPDTLAAATLELAATDDEREVIVENGQRFVFRLDNGLADTAFRAAPPTGEACMLSGRSGSSRGTLGWVPAPRPGPGPRQVEIAVAATGLNFRDVMWQLGLLPEEALEDGYAGPRLGLECAGTVSAIGDEVDGLGVGDRVVAFVSGGFASHVIAPTFAVSRLPPEVDLAAAATLPVAYLTAYYALIHLAGLKRDETVLIHGGAGAVGLAALMLARQVGARAIVTAGSEEKRALLGHLGADTVLNSRTLAFSDDIAALTGGRGVDVVLNSLSGEAMIRSMDCLRPFGRFLELGKRDYYANTHIGLRPFRRNLSYFGIDVDQLIGEQQALAQRLFGEMLTLLADGTLRPLPHRVLPAERIDEAFRLMQRSAHIGKIVVRPPAVPTQQVPAIGRFPVDGQGLHVVIGGTSGFGLATAAWLVERGARYLVLASRSGTLTDEARAQVDALQAAGATIEIVRLDVTDGPAVRRMVGSLATQRPIKGIIHAAMVLDDRRLDEMDRAAVEGVLRPKIDGAHALVDALGGHAIDYLLLYSSATTLLGNPGQYNYVAANGWLEGLAASLQRRGVPALSVAWGGIGDTGWLARHLSSNASLRRRFNASLLSARDALDALDLACTTEGTIRFPTLAIARIDWATACRELTTVRREAFSAIAPTSAGRTAAEAAIDLEALRSLPIDEAAELVLELVVREISHVLRLPAREVERHRPLTEIGMDSLMMLELRSTVEEALQIELPLMSLANGITPADVARRIAKLAVATGPASGGLRGQVASAATSHVGQDVDAVPESDREAAARLVLDRARRMEGLL